MDVLKRLWEKHKIIVIVSAIWVLMGFAAYAEPSEETGEAPTVGQYLVLNIFDIGLVIGVDYLIIRSREKKMLQSEEEQKRIQEQKELAKKEMSVWVNVKSGALGFTGNCLIHQIFENKRFYLGNDRQTLYEMVEYDWDGAKYKKATSSQNQSNMTGRNRAGGLVTGGMVIAATGKTNLNSQTVSSGNVVEQDIEEMGEAIIRMKNVENGQIVSFVINCNSYIDKQIRCFEF